ncbi:MULTISPECIES: hypothetical protein [Sphingobacterium]|jgi:hypothetical protein|uniref:hypothetical protein n=1 Tax=Sphingobacterium TaxID=28453 RepID=UPI00257A027E|nr:MULTISPECIES: hypothetical protein [Sphingobacterium]
MGKDAKYTMYARASTWVGMARYLEENQNLYRNFEIFMMPADKSIDQVEETEQAIYQQEIIQDLINQNAEIMKCLHCGAMISTNDSFTVEIDELDLRAAAGNVHKECLRPVDRMIGRSIFPDATETLLTNFDYQKWADLIAKGQYFINSVVQVAKGNPLAMISWNKEHLRNTGNYCVWMALSDGTTDYLRSGRSIERFSEEEIDQHLEMIAQNEIKMGKLSIKKIFGSLDYLSSIKSEDEDLFSVTQYTKVRYSNQLDGSDLQDYNDYAPLGLLKSLEGKTILLDDGVRKIDRKTAIQDVSGGDLFYLFRFARIKISLQLGIGKKEQFRNTESAVGEPLQITCDGKSIDTGLPFDGTLRKATFQKQQYLSYLLHI